MATLDANFEDDLREAMLDAAEEMVRDLGDLWKQRAAQAFQEYAARNGYDIQHVWQDAEGPFVDRQGTTVQARIEWPGLTALFEWGVEPHVIQGSPLKFKWESPPEGTRPPDAPPFVVADSVNWGSVTGGIPEARAIREGRDVVNNALEMD